MGRPWSNARRVRAYLAKHQVECPTCRYPLHQIRHPNCPECGRELLIDDILLPPPPDRFVRLWQVQQIVMWATLALFGVVFIAAMREVVTIRTVARSQAPGAMFACLFLGGLLVGVIRHGRRRYQRRRTQASEFERFVLGSQRVMLGLLLFFAVALGGLVIIVLVV